MEAAPLHEDVAAGPPGGEAWWLPTVDGGRIRVAAWPAAAGTPSRGTVLIFPGRTEYVEKYGPAAAIYAAEGYAVLTLDWRGQGLTARAFPDRRLGHVLGFAEYQRDLAAALNLAGWLDLPMPMFLVAHSMGGCIGLRALHEGLDVAAVAFSAPMWGMQMDAWERPLAWLSALAAPLPGIGGRLTPRTTLDHAIHVERFEGNTLTTDREMWDFMRHQLATHPDLTLGGPTLRWLRAALFETRALRRMAPPATPALTFLGTNERIVEVDPIREKMQAWSGARLEIVPDAEHEILMERPEVRNRFFDASLALFDKHG
ncbi:alpha/beta hydrolase [Sinisalibacter lacisalsi]|uniref:Hydrolase n=1 Tax=Sinisalibacter lacisalsi TaxID=1526570 RepID=A0ABQ1QR29_9RHOB|nr:alpha/beta hydrolase [Sinisalibacter lacisalsi]GGD40480.1 hydrolase [Sinisalibacter lacisalsi]